MSKTERKTAKILADARRAGVSRATLYNHIAGKKVSKTTLRKLEKIKPRLRQAAEVSRVPFRAPRRQVKTTEWSVERIRCAVDAQMRGDFFEPVRLAETMKKDDAMFVAFHNRIAPQFAVETKIVPAPGARGEACARKAAVSCIVQKSVLASIHGTLADHGIAIGYNEQEVNDEATRTDFHLTEWPLEAVKFNTSTAVLQTRTHDGRVVDIVHGDGRWTIFRKFNVEPWKKEACVLPGGMVWAAHQYGLVDWSAAARSHGRAKVIGEMPEGFALADEDGNLTPEAESVLEVLSEILEGEAGAGIIPFGADANFVTNSSSAWQVFSELASNREKAGARIYLGTDAILGSVGGAPGIDIAELFKVAGTKLQGDFGAIEAGLYSGLYQPWAAVNEGDSRNAPSLLYLRPDPDTAQTVEQIDKRRTAFFTQLDLMRKNGMVITQKVVNTLAAQYKIDCSTLELAPAATTVPTLVLAPTTLEKIASIDELRQTQNFAAKGTPRNQMTPAQAEEADKAAAQASVKKTPDAAPPPAPPAPGAA